MAVRRIGRQNADGDSREYLGRIEDLCDGIDDMRSLSRWWERVREICVSVAEGVAARGTISRKQMEMIEGFEADLEAHHAKRRRR